MAGNRLYRTAATGFVAPLGCRRGRTGGITTSSACSTRCPRRDQPPMHWQASVGRRNRRRGNRPARDKDKTTSKTEQVTAPDSPPSLLDGAGDAMTTTVPRRSSVPVGGLTPLEKLESEAREREYQKVKDKLPPPYVPLLTRGAWFGLFALGVVELFIHLGFVKDWLSGHGGTS
ncbi:hypothetical protein CDCA_CDCA15G3997 [Cyanidium caldarium]|uniref:Uncharacterized protein n=1 Tax=Cyanidium caldarium TaxID=2771 RepID=A0AAV9J066_CYACA|nr:hypothetical protein CDCA_CDCA15G3997 [Cyanidium caldarium]